VLSFALVTGASAIARERDMLFRIKKSGALTVLIFETPNLLNGLDIESIETGLSAILDAGDRHILLDFKRVKHISSPALSMILRIHSKLAALPDGQLALCDLKPQLMEAIKITRLDRLMPLFPTRTEALAWAKTKFSVEKNKVDD
jgi:anti-anti-sigma factor